jgi:hypothetical protein
MTDKIVPRHEHEKEAKLAPCMAIVLEFIYFLYINGKSKMKNTLQFEGHVKQHAYPDIIFIRVSNE